MILEKVIIDYLKTALSTDCVYPEMPDPAPTEFYVIDKTGSSTEDRLCTATVAIQSYAATKLCALEMNEALKEAMESIEELDEISGCNLVTDYNFTNTTKKHRRYQAVYEITHY